MPLCDAQGPVAAPDSGCARPDGSACETAGSPVTMLRGRPPVCDHPRPFCAKRAPLPAPHVGPPDAPPAPQVLSAPHRVRPVGYGPVTPQSGCVRRGSAALGFPAVATPRGSGCAIRRTARPARFPPDGFRVYRPPHQSLPGSARRRLCSGAVFRSLLVSETDCPHPNPATPLQSSKCVETSPAAPYGWAHGCQTFLTCSPLGL